MSPVPAQATRSTVDPLLNLVPQRWRSLENPRRDLPKLAKDPSATARIEALLTEVPTRHELFLGDSRTVPPLAPESIHLVVTTTSSSSSCSGSRAATAGPHRRPNC